MRDAAVVSGVLGVGCAVVFALAALAWAAFPSGSMVRIGYWGGGGGVVFEKGPEVMPAIDPGVIEMPADGAEK